jgi:hypothetical protein
MTATADQHVLFVDLDGVLADFEAGVVSVTGKLPHDQPARVMWKSLARTDRFYETLPWMSDGKRLWEEVAGLDPTILTGLPLGRWAEPQKRAWCARELGSNVPVITCMSRAKAKHARAVAPDPAVPVLIDDRLSLRDSWVGMGGVFIHHTGAEQSIEQLRALCGFTG